MKPIVIHQLAQAELDEAMAYYEEQKTGLGRALQTEVERAIERIRQNPEIGGWYKSTEFRHITVRRFPYVLFYMDIEEAIWVTAVAHGKRRPGYWRRRRPD